MTQAEAVEAAAVVGEEAVVAVEAGEVAEGAEVEAVAVAVAVARRHPRTRAPCRRLLIVGCSGWA